MAEILTEEILMDKTPQELTAILYRGCIGKLKDAKRAMKCKDYIGSNRMLQDCCDIYYRLGGGLNYKAGIVADQLDSLYNYCVDMLVRAIYERNEKIIDHIIEITESISEAWNIAMKKNLSGIGAAKKMMAYEEHLFAGAGKLDIVE